MPFPRGNVRNFGLCVGGEELGEGRKSTEELVRFCGKTWLSHDANPVCEFPGWFARKFPVQLAVFRGAPVRTRGEGIAEASSEETRVAVP